jgi:NAD(P)-dependent dehydrogenase (short-subunit alcohol dehydrogenase family)
MQKLQTPLLGMRAGVIMVTASAGGLYPMPLAPVYAAAKSGAVQAVRSVAERLMNKYGIRISALCPQVRVVTCSVWDPELRHVVLKCTIMDGEGARLWPATLPFATRAIGGVNQGVWCCSLWTRRWCKGCELRVRRLLRR